jgi:SAM-dependent methyltransferase
LSDTFDPNAYWRDRVGQDATLGVVGHRSLGIAYNEYIYRRRLDALGAILDGLGAAPNQQTVLDIGCGTGFYSGFWHRLGVSEYLGVDLSDATVPRLRAEFPNFRFEQMDITEPIVAAGERQHFSIITVFDVFYHIVDDAKFLAALRNIHEQLAPGGVVLVFDQLASRDYMLRKHVKFRQRDAYHSMLREAGLRIVDTRKLFSFLVPPIFGCRPVDVAVAGLYKVMGVCMNWVPPLGKLLGKALYEFDRLLLGVGLSTPNNELFVIRRSDEICDGAAAENA